MFYFTAYLVYTGIITVVHLIFTFWDKDEEIKTQKTCTDIELNSEQTNPWLTSPYKDMDDCLYWVRFYIAMGQVFGMSIFLFVQTHFVLVLYTHYKNALLVRSKGGCLPDIDSQAV